MLEQLRFVLEILPELLIGFPGHRPGGLLATVVLALAANLLGFGLAVVISFGFAARRRSAQVAARLYVRLFQGLPLLVLLLFIYQIVGSPRYGLNLSPRAAALIALSLYSAAYQAGILRAGLASVPTSISESARVIGSSRWRTFRTVELRYAFRVMLPALTGQAISIFKDTSVVVILGVADLMTTARIVLGSDLANLPHWVAVYLTVGALYFVVAFAISRAAQRWERYRRSDDLVHSLVSY
jgi:general L-amino acid transport system permease protein